MLRRWLLLAGVVLVACLLVARLPLASAAPVVDPSGKIAPWVLAQTAAGAQAEFLVVLASQADLSGAARLATKAEKGRFVYDTLYRTAQATQGPIVQWLKDRQIDYRTYYIVNAIWVKADRATAMALAARSDVARLDGNPTIKVDLPKLESPSSSSPLSPNSLEPGLTYVHAPEVWAAGFTGQGIVVGGQDTGIQWDHPALKPHYRGWNGSTANHDYNWHDSIHSGGGACGANSAAPCDDYGHGTHTIGTAVGGDGGTNQIGMAPDAKFIGCRNMNVGVGTPTTYLECFEFFLAPYPVGATPAQGDPAKAPDVTNNSWGCPPSEGCNPNTLLAAVQAQRAAGIMTVASAGNDGVFGCNTVQDPPGIYDEVYTVGALNTGSDTAASFSSRGAVTVDGSQRTKPDIAAPGTGTRSSIPGSGYGSMSGTSMASPHVAGAVALLWSARPQLRHQIAATIQVLNDSAVHISSSACGSQDWPNNTYGHGRLDVRAALDYAAISPLRTNASGAVGAPVTYTLHLINGLITDTYDLKLGPSPWPAQLSLTRTVELAPGAYDSAQVSVTIPPDVPAFASTAITVAVTSQLSPTRSSSIQVTAMALPHYAVGAQALASTVTGLPGSLVSHTLVLTNTGNITDTYTLLIGYNHWLASVVPAQVTLAPNATTSATAAVLVPVSATSGASDTLSLSIMGSGAPVTLELTTLARQLQVFLPLTLR